MTVGLSQQGPLNRDAVPDVGIQFALTKDGVWQARYVQGASTSAGPWNSADNPLGSFPQDYDDALRVVQTARDATAPNI